MEDNTIRTVMQCDFDGTVTLEDISFSLLDRFAPSSWRTWLEKHRNGEITVGQFNTIAFSLVRATQEQLFDCVKEVARLRSGLHELVNFCRRSGIDFIIISNGLDFYIDIILQQAGLRDVRVLAALTEFDGDRLRVKYPGPAGNELLDKFKETYTRQFLAQGCRVIYVGNGVSDLPPARLTHRIFACQKLADACRREGIPFTPFETLHDVVHALEKDGI